MPNPVTLSDLNQFTVSTVDRIEDGWQIAGRFSLPGRFGAGDSIYLFNAYLDDTPATVTRADPHSAVLHANSYISPSCVPGATFPAFDDYWYNAICTLFDPARTWRRVHFHAPDSFVQPSPYSPGWNVSRPAEAGDASRTDGHLVPGGWDHEHCFICNTHIDADHPDAYVNEADTWACAACYERYVLPRDLRFIADPLSDLHDPAVPDAQKVDLLIDAYDPDGLRALLTRIGNPNTRNPAGYTPLMTAAHRGLLPLVRLLLDLGADPNASNAGYTPLALAAQAGHYDLLDPLLTAGARTDITPSFSNGSLLHFLQTGPGRNDPRIADRLKSAGAT